MPQVFQVVCCYNCNMFQVQQVKKSNKWQCKICNEKQSLKKAFKIGSAPDCRFLVQELNIQRGRMKVLEAKNSAIKSLNHLEEKNQTLEFEEHRLAVNESADNCYREQFTSETKHDFEKSFDVFEQIAHENEDADDESRCSPGYQLLRLRKEDVFVQEIEDYIPSGNLQFSEASNCCQDVDDKLLEASGENYKSVDMKDCKESQKCFLEIKTDISSLPTAVLPAKKNRGFQMIKNAASRLN